MTTDGTSTAPTYRELAGKGLIRENYLSGEVGTGGVSLLEEQVIGRTATYRGVALTQQDTGMRREIWHSATLTLCGTHVSFDNMNNETPINGIAKSDVQAAE